MCKIQDPTLSAAPLPALCQDSRPDPLRCSARNVQDSRPDPLRCSSPCSMSRFKTRPRSRDPAHARPRSRATPLTRDPAHARPSPRPNSRPDPLRCDPRSLDPLRCDPRSLDPRSLAVFVANVTIQPAFPGSPPAPFPDPEAVLSQKRPRPFVRWAARSLVMQRHVGESGERAKSGADRAMIPVWMEFTCK